MKFISKFDRNISVLYILTIVVIVITSYFTFKEVINSYNKSQHQAIIPLFSIITSEVIRPLNVASFMANDPLLTDFIEQEKINKNELLHYLQRLAQRYNMLTFIALEKHNLILDSNDKLISLSNENAEWYQRLKSQNKDQFADIGNSENPHLYFDMKLVNDQEEFLGFIGVAIDLNHFANKFKEYSKRFGFELIFVDQNNDVMLSSNHFMKTDSHHRKDETINIGQLEWYQDLLSQEGSYQITNTIVSVDSGERIISQMPIQALNWRMFILAPPVSQQDEYWQLFLTRIGVFLILIAILYYIFINTVDYFKNRLVEDSETDFLTKLPNRSFLNWKFEELICEYEGICVVIADIDYFKVVNDTYGHVVGDEVLKEVATQLNNNLRHEDISGRWGGEEFVMLLPNTSSKKALEIVERLRENIANTPFKVSSSNHQFNITISFGVCESTTENVSFKQLIEHADIALYEAKNKGRNQSKIYKD
ncbi:MAG: GGDEF domain-containing protein [Colwelliaceae bacterium]|nr:GGDEF domain-containing protein [Colwelliaceae bacterium]